MAVPTGITMLGPGASAHNSVTANGYYTQDPTISDGSYVWIDTTTLPKFVIIFNRNDADGLSNDGWYSATMDGGDVVLWASALMDTSGVWCDLRAIVFTGDDYIKMNEIRTSTALTNGYDEITGIDLAAGGANDIAGDASETVLYYTLGSFTPHVSVLAGTGPGYKWWGDTAAAWSWS